MDTIAEHDRRLYVADAYPMYDEPIMVTSFYPTGIPVRDYEEYVGRRADRIAPGVYQPHTPPYTFAPRFALTQYGQTVAEFTIREPIPCPKVRKGIETRYMAGQWTKSLATGWIPA